MHGQLCPWLHQTLLTLSFLMLVMINHPRSAVRPHFGHDSLRQCIPLLLQFSPLSLLECHPDDQDEKGLYAPHEELRTTHSLKYTAPYSGASNYALRLSGIIKGTNSTLNLVPKPNRRSIDGLCVSGLVSAMYHQFMLHGPQPGKDLSLLSMMLLLLLYTVVQIRCPGQDKAGRRPRASHGKLQRGYQATGRRCCESRQSSDGVQN